jgi:hypothetical protein
MSIFIEQPSVGQLLATRGGSVEVEVIAAILNRTVPMREEIAKGCMNLYTMNAIKLMIEHPQKTKIGSRVTSTETSPINQS